MSEPPESHDVPTWKFIVAIIVVVAAVALGTLFWMARDARPHRGSAIIGKPQPDILFTNTPTNR